MENDKIIKWNAKKYLKESKGTKEKRNKQYMRQIKNKQQNETEIQPCQQLY